MWKTIGSSLCALLLYGSTPNSDVLRVPSGEHEQFEYMINAPIIGTIGSVVWEYKARGLALRSEFTVETTSPLVTSFTKSNYTKIVSINVYNKGKLQLKKYRYEEKEKNEELKFGLLFQRNKTECKKQTGDELVAISCKGEPDGKAPGLFALLAAVTYVDDLEARVKEKNEEYAYYSRGKAKITLEKEGKKVVEVGDKSFLLVMYNVKNIGNLLKEEDIGVKVGLRETHPHFMEYAEIKVGSVTLTVKRKQ